MRLRPIPGIGQALEYRNAEGQRAQRCSKCHRERAQSSLVLAQRDEQQFHPIMVGQDLLGVLCSECQPDFYAHVQSAFPDFHAFPFVAHNGEALPNPRCERGHSLRYTDDGRGMVCMKCDVPRADVELVDDQAPELG